MEKIVLKVGEYQKMPINRAFDGFKVTLVQIAEDLAAGNLVAAIQPDKINFKLRDMSKDDLLFDLSLAELHLLFRAGQLENNGVFAPLTAGIITAKDTATSTHPTKMVTDLSFEFPTMHGDYELHVRVEAGAMPANSDADSYICVTPNHSTNFMSFQTRVKDFTMDKKQDTYEAESGACQRIVIMDKAEIAAQASTNGFVSEISDIVLSSVEESFSYTQEEIIGNSLAQTEDATTYASPLLIVHDNHLLNGCTVMVKQSTVASNKLYMIIRNKTELASISEAIQEQNNANNNARIPY